KGVILHQDPNDVSTIAAGRDIFYAGTTYTFYDSNTRSVTIEPGLQIAGPGTLEVTAGQNLYQGSSAAIDSIGPIVTGDTRPGANVVLQAGVGAGTPGVGAVDWDGFAALYLDPANQIGMVQGQPLPLEGSGKVAKTYNDELFAWMKAHYGYTGTQEDAFVAFQALPGAQQRVFLRTVYYAELTAGGREYNDPDSSRFGSYLRGRNAIAALFPKEGAYSGDITLFSVPFSDPSFKLVSSGYVHTDFGGDIQLLTPGGGITVGTEGLSPGANAGLITQGAGNIEIYANDSVLLGLSRIMTTFGGDILAWSAEGDINAGRGAKTTVLFTPPRRTYDLYGQASLAPQVPSTGAGIATLAPIPEVPAGDIDLIAPLGTVDAGEAGIRVSGDINIAALHVVNAANIQVKGNATGLPQTAAVNTGALTAASNAATAVSQLANQMVRKPAPMNVPMIMTVQFVGFGAN
ncbi:MAG TPA: filamentous hemagglutinin family protein, partial [Rhizomicrobium sp.]|nr:filamentous hemagglutinin family protein [Rhizomicrobium sp.]